MKVPISWLSDYVDITLPIEELAERLTLAGLEVGSIQYLGTEKSRLPWDRERIVVGHIVAVNQHPDADRLVLADVDYGGAEIETVVTGAPNLFPYIGQEIAHLNLKSPFAMEGVTLYDGHKNDGSKMKLKGRPVRGIMNRHMLCSEKELGISESHEGILILDPDAPTGEPLIDVLGTAVLDIDLTPNIARCASIIGVAREVAALTGQKVRYPDYDALPMTGEPIEGKVVVSTTEPALNPRFCFTLIENVTIKPSPFWMQLRLRLAGMRPINNIVDVSNYVMLEMGQPNHAFDYDFLRARADHYAGPNEPIHVITRLAEPGEKVTTLDDVERKMEPFTILVTDPDGPLSIGGVMGGAESEVRGDSKDILLEAAAWDFINIRRSVKAYNLPSEAAYRFSRGVHPSQARIGALRAAALIQAVGGGAIAQGMVDYYPAPPSPTVVELPVGDVFRLLGVELAIEEVEGIFEALEFEAKLLPNESWQVTAPNFRMDIGTGVVGRADLIEEIARIYGYDRLPDTQIDDAMPPQRDNQALLQEERIKDLLVNLGLQEIMTYRLTSPDHEAMLNPSGEQDDASTYVHMANPISAERTAMRHRLLTGMLDVMADNARHTERIRLFEIGQVYYLSPQGGDILPEERRQLVISITGPRMPMTWQGSDEAQSDFFDLKGLIEALFDGIYTPEALYEPVNHPSYHPGRTAQISIEDTVIGVLGQLHPVVQEAFDMAADAPVLAAEIDLDALLQVMPDWTRIQAIPRYPSVSQDIAVVIDEKVSAQQVLDEIRETGGQTLRSVDLFDVYRGEQVGVGKKSLAYKLVFNSPDRTLTDKQVAKMQDRIVKRLESRFGAKLRS
jgi:phenylalanyl-tRNA synthetase beta chain